MRAGASLVANLELLRDLTSLDTEVSYTGAVIWAYVPAADRCAPSIILPDNILHLDISRRLRTAIV